MELRNVTRKSSESHSFGSAMDPGQVTPIYQEAIPPKSLLFDSPQNEDYTSPGPVSPSNEYDVIKDKGAASRPTRRQQTENVLYGDHNTFAVAHPTLTVPDTKRGNHDTTTAASSSKLVRSKSDSPSPVVAVGRRVCSATCLLFALLLFTVLVAVAALVLAVLLFAGVKPIASSSSASGKLLDSCVGRY